MAPTNDHLAAAFDELADLSEITGADRFRVLAYRRAAATLRGLVRNASSMSERELARLQGIGKATAGKIRELAERGRMAKLDELRAGVPPGVRRMTEVAGLGPKRAMLLHRRLGISDLDELREAAETGRLRQLEGFGEKTEANLLTALARHEGGERRMLLGAALVVAEGLVAELAAHPAVERASYAGSLRRMRETIGDLDLLVATREAAVVMDAFGSLPAVDRAVARGPTKSTIVTQEGVQVDLRAVAPDEWGAALQYFTGSKDHNVKVREHAVRLGFKLSEYGLFRVDDDTRVAAETEEDVYAALGMQTPPPTIREDRGEVALALRHRLPRLVQREDLQGELHSHSTWSDGKATILEMARAAADRGLRYLVVTDHAPGPTSRSLRPEGMAPQAAEIAEANEALGGRIVVLQGIEANIGPEGDLDFPDELLARFDLVVASLHDDLDMEGEAMTRRVLKALRNPHVRVFGHPSARYIGRRPPAAWDPEAVFAAAAEHGVALEINANPKRLDLRDDHVALARELGCLFSIDTDAHWPSDFDRLRLGVFTAQRGWVTPDLVVNALPLDAFRSFLDRA
jgi:DNA polymerase (family 10)